jgi:exodeoxyribonuclease VII large subunit
VHGYKSFLYNGSMKLESLAGRLHKLSPVQQLAYKQQWNWELTRRLRSMVLQLLKKKRDRLTAATILLDAMSPLGVLGRGYAVVRSGPQEKPPGDLIRSTKQLAIGKNLEVQLQEGKFACEVKEIKEVEPPTPASRSLKHREFQHFARGVE